MFLLRVLVMMASGAVASTNTTPKYQGLLVVSGSTAAGSPTCNFMDNNSNFTWKNLEILLPTDSVDSRGGIVTNDVGSEQGYNQPFNETMEFVTYTFASAEENPTIQFIVNNGVVWSGHVFGQGYEEYSAGFVTCDYNETAPAEGIYAYGGLIFALNYTALDIDTSGYVNSFFSTNTATFAISLLATALLILLA